MVTATDLYQQGFTLHKQGLLDEAEIIYKQALHLEPDNLNCLFMLANLKYQQCRFPEAAKYITSAINLSTNIKFYDLLCRIKLEQKQYKAAIESAIKGLRINPESFELNFNIALAFKNYKEYELSLKFYQRAEKLRPDSYLVPYNMSGVYFFLGDPEKSTEAMRKALALMPGDEELEYFLAISLFREKKYKEGLPLFENRVCKKTATILQEKLEPSKFDTASEWHGEDISGKTVFMFYEAGYGDVLQYARYFPLLKERCSRLIFKPQNELVELFKENPLGLDEVLTYLSPTPDFDIFVPMLSLPYLLGLDESNMFISRDGYLKSNPEKKEMFRKKFFNTNKIKIGIKWQGNTASETDRVIDVKAFIPLFGLPNTQFYSFQTGDGSEALDTISKDFPIIDISKEFSNFSDTAAALDNLDYVICNDTSLLHLAGALHKTSYMLLPLDYNWRWHLDLSNNDWYSSVKMFKQKTDGEWSNPIQELYEDFINTNYK